MSEPVDARQIKLRMGPRGVILDVAQRIAAIFHPQRIILFGSYAYGNPTPESDVDMLVVMDTALGETEQAVVIAQTIVHHFGLDLLVRTPKNLEHRLALGDPLLHEAVERGETLYAPSYA